jgi:hypothetical protein
MENNNLKSGDETPNFTSPKLAILVSVFIITLVPFYESKRVVIWETQREAQGDNIFRTGVLKYASAAEILKEKLGLSNFFNKEHEFWLELKKSPILFEESGTLDAIDENEEEKNIENQQKKPEGEKQKEELIQSDQSSQTKLEPPFRILILGDSFIAVGGGVGNPLESTLLTYKDVTVKRLGKVSSGLSRPDYFNWNLTAQEVISQFNPNIVIAMFGSNDNQGLITSDGKVISYGKEGWNEEYSKRVSNFLEIFEKNNIIVFWIGLPIMKEKNFSERVQNLNSIYETEVKSHKNSYFIPTWSLLADGQGNYTAYLADEKGQQRLARVSDGIHLQFLGGRIIVKEVIKKIEERIKLEIK